MNTARELQRMWRELKAMREELTAWRKKAGAEPAPGPQAPPLPELLTLKQAASRLACSTVTLRRLARRGELAIVHVGSLPKVSAAELRRIAERPPTVDGRRAPLTSLGSKPTARRYSVAEEKAKLAALRAKRKQPGTTEQVVTEALRQRREAARLASKEAPVAPMRGDHQPREGGEDGAAPRLGPRADDHR